MRRLWEADSGPVLVTHPVHQHAYETAVAAAEAGLLEAFVTSVYLTGRGLMNDHLWSAVPGRLGEAGLDALRRRWHPELTGDRVRTVARYQLAARAASRILPSRLPRLRTTLWEWQRFDAHVARHIAAFGAPPIVHVFEGAALASLQAAGARGASTVLDVPSVHELYRKVELEEGGDVRYFGTARVLAERLRADWLLAPSAAVAECLSLAGIADERIVRLPYGVDHERFAPSPRLDSTFRVAFVGSLTARKGIAYLLDAWRRLDLADSELLLIGNPDPAGARLIEARDASVRWIPGVPKAEVPRWLGTADAFVFPSLAEGWGLAPAEAMAAGLPVVVTRAVAVPIEDGVSGLFVRERNADDLAEAIAFLHAQRDEARAIGARARAAILGGYTIRHYRGRIQALYAALLAGRDPRPAVAGLTDQGCPPEEAVG